MNTLLRISGGIGILPFADLTLLASSSAIAIMISACLSIIFLGEVFIWHYDLTAMALIITGSTLIILQSDTTQKTFDSERVVELLSSTRTIVFLIGTVVLHAITACSLFW